MTQEASKALADRREAIALLFSDELRRRAGCIGTTPLRALDTVSQNGAYRFADAILSLTPAPTTEPVAWRWRYRITKDEGWSRWIPHDNKTIDDLKRIQRHNLEDGLCELQPLYPAPSADSAGIEQQTIERCAKHLENEADIATNSLHCGDNSQTIAATHRVSRAYHEAAKAIRALSPSPDGTPKTVCSLCLGTGKVFHENPPRKDTPWSKCHCGGTSALPRPGRGVAAL